MDRKRLRARLATCWYNLTERIAQAVLYVRLPEGLSIEKNIKYGKEPMERLDYIYGDASPKSKKPLFIYIHGGGWLSGIKDMRRYYCYEWAKQGFFVANLDYTYAPDKQFKGQLQQLFNAIDYVLDNESIYAFDTNNIVMAGESAGGYFILELAAILKDREMFKKLGLKFKHYQSFNLKALVPICGAVDVISLMGTGFPDIKVMLESFTGLSLKYLTEHQDDEEIRLMSPIHYINDSFPPTAIISAAKDPLRTKSYRLIESLKSMGVDYISFEGEGIISNHAWPIAVKVKKGRECFDAALQFVKKYTD